MAVSPLQGSASIFVPEVGHYGIAGSKDIFYHMSIGAIGQVPHTLQREQELLPSSSLPLMEHKVTHGLE